jgi:hypothetical protein
VQQRLVAINPLDDARTVALIDFLERAGRREPAIAALEKWGARACLSDEFAGKVAPLWVKLGHPELAEPLFEQVTGGAFGRSFEPYLGHARLGLARGDLPAAKRLLREAFRFPANRSSDDLVAWLEAAHKLEQADEFAADLVLTSAQTLVLHAALFTAFEKARQPSQAAALLSNHPASLQEGQAARLRAVATAAAEFELPAKTLELLSAQAPAPLAAETRREHALLLAAWSDADTLAGRGAEALLHLSQAHELQPAHWPIAEKLARLLRSSGDSEKARAVVERFLASSKDSVERQKAERLLVE